MTTSLSSTTAENAQPGALRGALELACMSVLLRILLLLMPGVQVSPLWVLPEELHRGNVARELLDGPLLDIQDYHHAMNVGGSLVVSVIAMPFVATLGPNLLAVRMPTVLLHALAVALLFVLLDRGAGRRAAWCGGALFALGPPGYVLLSITAWGTHVETNTFVLLALLVFQDLQAGAVNARRTSVRGFWLGVIAGFALYFGYSFVAALVALLVLAFVRDRAFFVRRWFVFMLLGFAIGLLPWVRYNVMHDFDGITIYEKGLVTVPPAAYVLDKLTWFFTSYLPETLFLRGFPLVDLAWATWPVAGVLGALCSYALWRARAVLGRSALRFFPVRVEPPPLGIELVCAVYLTTFTVAMLGAPIVNPWVQTAIAHDGRYATPLWPFACLAAGVGCARIAQLSTIMRRVSEVVVGLLVATFVAGFAALLDPNVFPGSLRQNGTSNEEFARWIAWRYKTDLPRLERVIVGLERRSEDVRDGTIFTISGALKSKLTHLAADDPRHVACSQALQLMRAHVGPRYAHYCEEPWPGEHAYLWRERAEFMRDRAAALDRKRAEKPDGKTPP